MSDPFVIAIILNTNRRVDTLACLDSLFANSYSNLQVIVLDNQSTDGSAEAIRSAYPSVQIITLTENLGYAGNNNVGIEAAIQQGADWVLVLNEDTVLDEHCLENLLEVGENDPNIGVVGPLVYHYAEPNVIQSAGGKITRNWQAYHIEKDQLDHGQVKGAQFVEWISGCAIMVRRKAIEQVNGIDPRFFYLFEETEWCVRIGKAGWKLMCVPEAKIWHKGYQLDYHPKPSFTYYETRNRFLLLSKHHAPVPAWIVAWFQTLRTLASWSVRPRWKHLTAHRDAMWQGIVDFLFQRWGQRPLNS